MLYIYFVMKRTLYLIYASNTVYIFFQIFKFALIVCFRCVEIVFLLIIIKKKSKIVIKKE